MEGYNKEGKLLNAIKSKTIRELVDYTNRLLIPRGDIVTILPENGAYVLLFYYLGIQ